MVIIISSYYYFPYVFFTDAYVADEIITSAAGVRIRIGNTDAEGRMAMSDPLHHTRLQVRPSVLLYTHPIPFTLLKIIY